MTRLLGGLSPATFLRRHWQKEPLLVRQAMPGFNGVLTREDMLALASRGDATSRLILEHPGRKSRWERHDGPFAGLDSAMLPARCWTLLVHGIESLVPGGWEILRAFSFIPAARVDDLMVSYAADGGSVGPHDDLYDVFLLQGPGRRRWQISRRPHEVDDTAKIKVLRNFVPEEEWLLEAGDMLYLPPGVAHWGVAEGSCFTYSIGFLAPTHQTLVQSFLGYLQQALPLDPDALYRDPGLKPSRDPLELGDAMLAQVVGILGQVRWDRSLAAEFLGRFLTLPKPHVEFTPPARPLGETAFDQRIRRRGRLSLSLPSRGLARRGRLFLNGEVFPGRPLARRLLAERSLDLPFRPDAATRDLFRAWYLAGYVRIS